MRKEVRTTGSRTSTIAVGIRRMSKTQTPWTSRHTGLPHHNPLLGVDLVRSFIWVVQAQRIIRRPFMVIQHVV